MGHDVYRIQEPYGTYGRAEKAPEGPLEKKATYIPL